MIEYWPIIVVLATGLIAHGRQSAKIENLRTDVDTKASKEVVAQVDARLDRIEAKLDRLLERN